MDNVTMARLLDETADLMEISGADSFRVRSYATLPTPRTNHG